MRWNVDMKVILVNGGPHQEGCTNLALEEIAKTLEKENIETEIIWLGVKPIRRMHRMQSLHKHR